MPTGIRPEWYIENPLRYEQVYKAMSLMNGDKRVLVKLIGRIAIERGVHRLSVAKVMLHGAGGETVVIDVPGRQPCKIEDLKLLSPPPVGQFSKPDEAQKPDGVRGAFGSKDSKPEADGNTLRMPR